MPDLDPGLTIALERNAAEVMRAKCEALARDFEPSAIARHIAAAIAALKAAP